MIGGGLEVGRVFTRVGALFDNDGFDKYDRRVRHTREEAKRGTHTKLGAKVDETGFDRYEARLRGVDTHQRKVGLGAKVLGGAVKAGAIGIGAGTVATGLLIRETGKLVTAYQESERVGRRQSLVIKTMGQDAGATAPHIDKLSASMERKIAVDDDAIKSTANVLRTFRNIRDETGKGNDVFDRALKASYDMQAAFPNAGNAAIMLGKALDNPAKGASALSRTGAVAKDDVEKLQKMAKDGAPILEQQRFLLERVEAQVKGTAASNATASDHMKASWGELEEFLGKKLAPTWDHVAAKGRKFVDQIIAGRGAGGRFADKVKDIYNAAKELGGKFVDAAADVGRFFKHHPELLKIAGTMAGIAASVKILGKIGNLTGITGLFKLATGIGKGGLLGGLASSAKPVPVFVTNPGGLPGGEPIPGKAPGKLARAASFVAKAVPVAAAAYGAGAVFTGIQRAFGIDTNGDNSTRGRNYVNREADTAQSNPRLLRDKAMIYQQVVSINRELAKTIKAEKELGGNAPLNRDGKNVYTAHRKELEALRADLEKKLPAAARAAASGFTPMSKASIEAAQRVVVLRDRLGHLKKGTDEYRATAHNLRGAQNDLNDSMSKADRAGRKGAKGILTIGDGAFSASGAVAGAATSIAANVDQLAKGLGAKGVSFHPVTASGSAIGGHGATLAHGGRVHDGHAYVGRRGARGRDARAVMGPNGPEALVGDGELMVFNGDQQAALAVAVRREFQTSLDGFFAGKWRRHSDTARYEHGGLIPDVTIQGPSGGYRRDAQGASDKLDRAAERRAKRILNEPINRMIRFARGESSKFPKYVYGGGHGGFHGPYDCSGYVSAILHAGGLLNGGPITTDGLKNYGLGGDGERVTVGVRGSTGRNAHTMIHVGNTFFEAGGHGVGERGGWDGVFPIHRHPKGYELGGEVDMGAIPPELADRLRRDPSLLDPNHPDYVGLGLDKGGKSAKEKAKATREKHQAALDAHYGKYTTAVDHVQALARAGKIKPTTGPHGMSADQIVQARLRVIGKRALKGKYGTLRRSDKLAVKGDVRDARAAAKADAYERYQAEVDRINGLMRAGALGPKNGRRKLLAAATAALTGQYGTLTSKDRIAIRGDYKEYQAQPEPSVLSGDQQKFLDALTANAAQAEVDTPFVLGDPSTMADDIRAVTSIRDFWQARYDDAVKNKRPKTIIAQIASTLAQARTAVTAAWDQAAGKAPEAGILTDDQQTELDDLTGAAAMADADTPYNADAPDPTALDDDVAAADKLTAFWEGIYSAAKDAKRPKSILGTIATSLKGARDTAASLRATQTGAAQAGPEAAAAQAQVLAQNAALRRTNDVQAAAIGVFGSGGDVGETGWGNAYGAAAGDRGGATPHVVYAPTFQSAFPPSPEQQRQAAGWVGEGFAGQGAPISPRVESPL